MLYIDNVYFVNQLSAPSPIQCCQKNVYHVCLPRLSCQRIPYGYRKHSFKQIGQEMAQKANLHIAGLQGGHGECILSLSIVCGIQCAHIYSITFSINTVKMNSFKRTIDSKHWNWNSTLIAKHTHTLTHVWNCVCCVRFDTGLINVCACYKWSTLIQLLAFAHIDLLQWRITSLVHDRTINVYIQSMADSRCIQRKNKKN